MISECDRDPPSPDELGTPTFVDCPATYFANGSYNFHQRTKPLTNENTAVPSYFTDSNPLAYTPPDRLIQDFTVRGLVVLPPESLEIPLDTHDRIYERQKQVTEPPNRAALSQVPEVLEILNAPGVVAACNQLVGENWAVVPFTAVPLASNGRDQIWHKDDNSPANGRKQRHHHAVQIEILYYPQAVAEDMGPTAVAPYSHYWTLNHEENQDNFAGSDHIDFNYMIEDMKNQFVSGPDSLYDENDIIHRRTAHDIRMRKALSDLKWPLVGQFEVAPLRAGSVILYSHNIFHRANHRRDDWRTWNDRPRFMWRFWIYRTTEPAASRENGTAAEIDWNGLGIDPLTRTDLTQAGDDLTEVWRHHCGWMNGGQAPPPRLAAAELTADKRGVEAARLSEQLYAKHDEAEPARIGAAYRLASIGDNALAIKLLAEALYDERESVRRAATYGLVAVGPDATGVFLEAATSLLKWVRKAGVFGLGDVGPLNDEVLETVVTRLEDEPSVYVRSVAAGSLGCLGRRAVASGVGTLLVPACLKALAACLEREENRLCVNRAQNRGIKFARPTEECDVCEGGPIQDEYERFEPVRSAVRENALWSIVMLCSHGTAIMGDALEPTIRALKTVVQDDRNAVCVGFAADALTRLVNLQPAGEPMPPPIQDLRANLMTILKTSPVHSLDALTRAGLSPSALTEFAPPN